MSEKRNTYDQNRRDAMYWAEEWRIKQRKRKILIAIGAVVAVIALGFIINYISILGSRTVFSSEEEMKAYVQGRFAAERYVEFDFDGDDVTLIYYNLSHYDLEYAERWGCDDYGDSVYEDKVEKWDYRRGVIKCKWMDDIIVDKDGDLVYYDQKFTKTDEPAPEPLAPEIIEKYRKHNDEDELNQDGEELLDENGELIPDDEQTEEEQSAAEEQQESLEETQDAAEDAGIVPDVETDAI